MVIVGRTEVGISPIYSNNMLSPALGLPWEELNDTLAIGYLTHFHIDFQIKATELKLNVVY